LGKGKYLRHFSVAVILAVLASYFAVLLPLDITAWLAQAKLGEREASQEIVFVEIPQNALERLETRNKLATAISELENAGSERIFLDTLATGREYGAKNDALNDAVLGAENVYLVGKNVVNQGVQEWRFPGGLPVQGAKRTVEYKSFDPFGFVWNITPLVGIDGSTSRSFSSLLANQTSDSAGPIEIDYRFASQGIPRLSLDQLVAGEMPKGNFKDKSFVFGFGTLGLANTASIPGERSLPVSYISIMAAETIKAGGYKKYGGDALIWLVAAFLLLGFGLSGRQRHAAYGAATMAVFSALLLPIFFAFRIEVAPALLCLIIFGVARLIERWRGAHRLESTETGLPSLLKLEQVLAADTTGTKQAIIVAKIHGFSDVMASIPKAHHLAYFDTVVGRLRIADKELAVFASNGAYLIWTEPYETQDLISAHLSALRAIFANPLKVAERTVDVSLTFGIETNFTAEPSRRIADAIAIADQTSLADQPLIFGDVSDDIDREWKISLQSKIDVALDNGEIFPVFQPQYDVSSGEISGFEALVRWEDPERGFISPEYFIEQCEQAGRMEKLTRFMLESSIRAFKASRMGASDASLSINVSATLLGDTRLVQVIHEVLEKQGFPYERLIIEITETARIRDTKTATSVLNALASVGVKLSLDDFGTGTAGMETLYLFPFTEVKIDRLFTKAIATDAKARAIAGRVIDLGRTLDIVVVCEGVEDERTLSILRSMGCPIAQGYLLGRPNRDPDFALPYGEGQQLKIK
jgi:EAL domain-containing protein (putative c-di-GMP-specific phosphodiesterase class I)/CHASE2 domain-containing sensor protein